MKLDHKTKEEWKPQLTIAVNFFSPKDTGETRTAYSTRDNMEILIGDKIIEDLSESLLQKYQ